jgi:ABC-type amino acid transport substrate-binding protein
LRCATAGQALLRQFQWWRLCKHAGLMCPALRQYQIDYLFANVTMDVDREEYARPTSPVHASHVVVADFVANAGTTDASVTTGRSASVASAAVSMVSSPEPPSVQKQQQQQQQQQQLCNKAGPATPARRGGGGGGGDAAEAKLMMPLVSGPLRLFWRPF